MGRGGRGLAAASSSQSHDGYSDMSPDTEAGLPRFKSCLQHLLCSASGRLHIAQSPLTADSSSLLACCSNPKEPKAVTRTTGPLHT